MQKNIVTTIKHEHYAYIETDESTLFTPIGQYHFTK